MTLKELQKEAHDTAVEKGWWDSERSITDCLLLIHSEVSEAVEEVKRGRLDTWLEGMKPQGLPIELADIIIRVLDLAEKLNIDSEIAVRTKMSYNTTRSYRHGGKRL